MANCKFAEKCPFFNGKISHPKVMADLFKQRYCQGSFERCARYCVRMALGPGTCPEDLFPNQHDRAEKLITKRAVRPASARA